MDAPNHYELLSVTPDATADQIRASYRKLIRIYHPDVSGAAGATMTLRLNRAESDLLDPVRRAQYDRTLGIEGSASHTGSSSWSPTQASNSPAWGASTRSSSMPPSGRPRTDTANPAAAGKRGATPNARRAVRWNANTYVAWLSACAISVGVILGGTAIVFANVYSRPMPELSPAFVPAFVVALAWIVAAIGRPPVPLIALLVLGSAIWPMAELGIGPLGLLNASVPTVVLALPTVIAVAVLALKIAAPRARALSRARPATRHPRFGTASSR